MKKALLGVAGLITALTVGTAAKADNFLLNYEAPGVQNTTATFSVSGVETFNEAAHGHRLGLHDGLWHGRSLVVTAAPNGVQINPADVYGGAGGTGNYIVAFGNSPYTLTLTADPVKDPEGINYFGYWLSALDAGNQVVFPEERQNEVGALTPADVIAKLGDKWSLLRKSQSAVSREAIAASPTPSSISTILNGTFDQVVFTENPAVGGYESDNHTVGFFTHIGGVPEPLTWAMLLLGFAGLGIAGYRSSRQRAYATA